MTHAKLSCLSALSHSYTTGKQAGVKAHIGIIYFISDLVISYKINCLDVVNNNDAKQKLYLFYTKMDETDLVLVDFPVPILYYISR